MRRRLDRVRSVLRPRVLRLGLAALVGALVGLTDSDLPIMDGVSLTPLLRGEADDLGLTAYSDSVNQMVYNFSPQLVDNKDDMLFALVIDGRWKYIHHLRERQNSELYDLVSDPAELVNLAAEEPEVMARANEALRKLRFMPVKQLEQANVPPDVLRALESLGYTGNESEVESPGQE